MGRARDPYVQFAPFYDRWQSLYAKPFSLGMTLRMRQAIAEWPPPERSLLDLACGTGTLAHWWARRHSRWEVWGVDRSAAMIERARQSTAKGGRLHRPPTFLVQDLTQLRLERRFGMVTCFFDSLNHVTRTQDLARILRGAYRALLPGGIFVFDLLDEDSFEEVFSTPSVVHDRNLFVAVETGCEVRRGSLHGLARFHFFNRDGERWDRHDWDIHERCWTRAEFDPMIRAAGLEIVHVQLIDPEEQPEVFVPRRLYVVRRAA
ncbi:MAG: class I SAM-dependent methyltransferase [Candidatus Eisenbacteria bacterium]|uniref:Class I SAM-dependent methyltransferase n=1 Tax=Eiseniibacteriota bacterium TaxID=2212470 RepID=A0A956RR19_UNCEI|nr:class I SAM-dependent methyltransferase [Candidatus Eisenbacteria bacterium]